MVIFGSFVQKKDDTAETVAATWMTCHDLTSWILFCWLWTDLWGFVQWYLYKGPLQDGWTVFEDEHNHYCQWAMCLTPIFLFHTETRFLLFFFGGGGGSFHGSVVLYLIWRYCIAGLCLIHQQFFIFLFGFLKKLQKNAAECICSVFCVCRMMIQVDLQLLHIFRACVFVWDDNAVVQSGWQWWYFMFKDACMYINVCFNLVQASVNTQRFNFQETKKKKSNCYWT